MQLCFSWLENCFLRRITNWKTVKTHNCMNVPIILPHFCYDKTEESKADLTHFLLNYFRMLIEKLL
jgi:hypothetical protein